MAAPITHIVLAEKIFDKFFNGKTKKDFFVGSLFPDIRYLKVIERKKTHFDSLAVSDIQNDDSFLAGLKFHSILDSNREKYILASGIYSLCPESKYLTQSLKMLEDKLFYRHIKNWQEYINYFNKILHYETDLRVAKKDIKRWHLLLQQYFQKQPDQESITNFILGIGFTDKVADEINKDIVTMRANHKIVSILENLYKNFETLLV